MTHRPDPKRSAYAQGLALLALVSLSVATPAAAEIEVTAADPAEAQEAPEGSVNLDVTISGNGFGNGAIVTFLEAGTDDPGGVAVRSVKVRGPKKIIANIDINEGTVPEGFDVQLFDIRVQLNGGVGKGTELFGVLKPEQGPSETIYDGAVGHALDCLPCSPDPLCVEGDFHDVGTESGCEPLTCSGGNQSASCGRRGHPKPRIDLSGLFHLWDSSDSQGDPTVCFPGGIVNSTVRTGHGGTISVQLSTFQSLVDGTLPGRCAGATDLVTYALNVESCMVTVGTYPPAVGDSATVTCLSGSEVSMKTEGGGGIAKKCGCIATGALGATTELTFLGVSD